MTKKQYSSEHFLSFVSSLGGLLDGEKNTEEFQKKQVETLFKAERSFRRALICHPSGAEVYQAFIDHIMIRQRNILRARVYFRERDVRFKKDIAPILRARKFRRLFRFDINYQFIKFALGCRQWSEDAQSRKLLKLADKAIAARNCLIQSNIPLAISRARLFFSRSRGGHHTFLDLLQTAVGGMCSGVDKYCGSYTPVFRAVLIGRMLGDLLEANSDTLAHLFPADKRRLYRARKIAAGLREGLDNVDCLELTKLLNDEELAKGEPPTSANDLVALVNAATVILASTLPSGEDDDGHSTSFIEAYPDSSDPADVMLEKAESRHRVAEAIKKLPLVDRKLLRLKGIDLAAIASS